MRTKSAFLLAWAIFLLSPNLFAGIAGIQRNIQATKMWHTVLQMQPNQTYCFQTYGLTSGADTVIHVQDYYAGTYLAGNDDYGAGWPGSPDQYASMACYANGSTAKWVKVLVRAYGSGSGGSANCKIWSTTTGTVIDTPISFSGTYSIWVSSFSAGTHFRTTHTPGTINDTDLLVIADQASKAIGYDDDTGVGFMSWIVSQAGCSSYCQIIPGAYSGSGNTTLLWDADVSVSDSDGDGLSNTLESVLGTSPSSNDSDGDNIRDLAEVYGVEVASNLLDLPYYGADPLKTDIFVEDSWQECPQSDTGNCWPGGIWTPDLYQVGGGEATQNARDYYGPEVALHQDIGRANSDPATWKMWNAWGGAKRKLVSDWVYDCAQWGSPQRSGYFYYGKIRPNEGLGGGCGFMADRWPGVMNHELGHCISIAHSGPPRYECLNCNPIYLSEMNYAYEWRMGMFSRNDKGFPTLYGNSLSESYGLGSTTYYSRLTGWPFYYMTNGQAIDWNRDGLFDSSGPVRAAIGINEGACDDWSKHAQQQWNGNTYNGTAVSHFGTALYHFARNYNTGLVEYRYATTHPTTCPRPNRAATCSSNWYPAISNAPTTIQNSYVSNGQALAATWYKTSTNLLRLMLLYTNSSGVLGYQVFNGSSWTNWSSLPNGLVISDNPIAVTFNEEAVILAKVGSNFIKWVYKKDGSWLGPVTQLWNSDSTAIGLSYGVGATVGYIDKLTGLEKTVVAAIPAASPSGRIDFAWIVGQSAYNNYWEKLPSSEWRIQAYTTSQPGIAYMPLSQSNLTKGQYYIARRSTEGWIRVKTSEGNTLKNMSYQRLKFVDPYLNNNDPRAEAGGTGNQMGVLFDLVYDTNVRMVTTQGGIPFVRPFADGRTDREVWDMNDYNLMTATPACGIGGSCDVYYAR